MLRPGRAVVAASALLLAGCQKESPSEAAKPIPVVTRLACANPSGQLVDCALTLDQNTGFAIELASSSCEATDNVLRMTLPVDQLLTEDACHERVPRRWDFPGPYPRNTQVTFQVKSAKFDRDPSPAVGGAYPEWKATFEDGYDADNDDLIFVIRAVPAAR